MMMNIYKYTITYFDEIENKCRERKGLVCGEFFTDVANLLTEYYGEQETESVSIEFITDSAVIESGEIPDDIKLEG